MINLELRMIYGYDAGERQPYFTLNRCTLLGPGS